MIEEATKTTSTVRDTKGREIEVRKLKPIDRLRMMEMIGADNSGNQPYLGYAILAYSVSKIDGDPVPRMSSKRELEGMVTRLDEEGLNAVGEAFKELYGDAENPIEAKETLKNG